MSSTIVARYVNTAPRSPAKKSVEAVCAADRRYFEENPTEKEFVRPYIPGELAPRKMPDGVPIVILVRRLAPGVRSRTPIFVEKIRIIPDDSDRRLPL